MNTNRFNQLLESKLGNVKPLICEQEDDVMSLKSRSTLDLLTVKNGDVYQVERYYSDVYSTNPNKDNTNIKVNGNYTITIVDDGTEGRTDPNIPPKDAMAKVSGPKSKYNTNIDKGLGIGTYEMDLVQSNCDTDIPGGAPLGCMGHSYDNFKIIKKIK